ncbi:MAG: hypothetical protein K2G44_06895 [Clostridia bacterium]|nr:hypothetical protein [Clostridia bacterium]
MRIAVDIDDTLNIVERAKRAGLYIARKNLPFKLKDENSNMFVNVYDWTFADVTEFMLDGGVSAFTEAKARKGAREALAGWRKAGHEVIILTARQKDWFGNPAMLSRDWLEKRKIPYDEIVAEHWDKGAYCKAHGISVLVDDTPDILKEAESYGITGVLAVGRHNLDRVGEFRYYGENWQQIDEAVQRIARQG